MSAARLDLRLRSLGALPPVTMHKSDQGSSFGCMAAAGRDPPFASRCVACRSNLGLSIGEPAERDKPRGSACGDVVV